MDSRPINLDRDPPSLLFKQLAGNCFAIVDKPTASVTTDALDVLTEWFQLPSGTKQAAATAAAPAGTAAAGRGFFALPDKEVLEVKQGWEPAGVQSTARLAANSAFNELNTVASNLLQLLFTSGPGLQVLSRDGVWVPVTPTPQQLVVLVGHTLSWATAGRLPAAVHRVVLPAPASGSRRSSSSSSGPRLSLAFKLQAAPDARFAPAAITGTPNKELDSRFRGPKRTRDLMAAFDALHDSIHNSSPVKQQQQQQQQQQQPKSKRSRTSSAAAAQPKEPRSLCISVKNMRGQEVVFRVKENTCMERVFDAFVRALQIEEFQRYTFEGRRIFGYETPRELGLQEVDIVDALLEQHGD
ncbi:hypothetical protein OEZ86_006800 [Tetradesmus obliquus]|nr:hypothetical protein OEZ86_006800 [Tetradesmus obliquus]